MRIFPLLFAFAAVSATVVSGNNTYAETQKPAKSPGGPSYHMKETQEDVAVPVEGAALSGKIVETMNSGGYTYLCLEKDGKKAWAAILETKVKVGDEIALQPGYEMVNFTSKTLNRTFDKIVFSTGPASPQGGGGPMGFHGKAMGGDESKAAPDEKAKVEKAPAEKIKVEKAAGANAYTVAELFQKCAELDKKNVVIKGKVVKVSAGIMKKNWLHIQDGSGDSKDANNDIVVTTKELAAVGDLVTVSGVLYKDKDFGSGYKYNVIVEDASIQK